MITLNVERRAKTDKLEDIRKSGKMPAVFYGPKDPATPISVTYSEFLKVWKKAGESTVISLQDGGDEKDALIKDVDRHPLTGDFRHADFYVIEKGKKLELDIPLNFVGVAPAVKDLGGILVKVLHAVKIQALPKDLPQNIEVDITTLATFESQILAKDLPLPKGVELVEKPEEVVASVAQPKDEPEEPAAPIDLEAIEVEKKGKKDEEGADAAAEGSDAPKAKDAK